MFLEIKDFLNPLEVARLRELAGQVQFVDGRISNPHNQSKKNLQATENDPSQAEAARIAGARDEADFNGRQEGSSAAVPTSTSAALVRTGTSTASHPAGSRRRKSSPLAFTDLSSHDHA